MNYSPNQGADFAILKFEILQPAANRKHSKFRPDEHLHPAARATNQDFFDSGWSRGHMAPAGNNKHCQRSMDDTFLLSNVVPQVNGTV